MPRPQYFVNNSHATRPLQRTCFTLEPKAVHTSCMEMYTLRLGAPLSWTPTATALTDIDAGIRSSDSGTNCTDPINALHGLVVPVLPQEGSEAVFVWDRAQLVSDGDDGPHLGLPLPPPLQTGISGGSSGTTVHSRRIELPAGSYLFCQGRLEDISSIEQTLEWFFREIWWTRAAYTGFVYLRLIREDGKTAVQAIMAREGTLSSEPHRT